MRAPATIRLAHRSPGKEHTCASKQEPEPTITFDGDERRDSVAGLASVTSRGGHLYVLCFSDVEPDTGSHPVSQEELKAAFTRGGWSIASVSPDRIQQRSTRRGCRHGWRRSNGSSRRTSHTRSARNPELSRHPHTPHVLIVWGEHDSLIPVRRRERACGDPGRPSRGLRGRRPHASAGGTRPLRHRARGASLFSTPRRR